MERDAIISHGASACLRERLMYAADEYQTVFCKTCGTFAINDATGKDYKPCRLCEDTNNFGRCTIPYSYKLLMHLLSPLGIFLRPMLAWSDEYDERAVTIQQALASADIATQLQEADEAYEEQVQEFEDQPEDVDFAEVYD